MPLSLRYAPRPAWFIRATIAAAAGSAFIACIGGSRPSRPSPTHAMPAPTSAAAHAADETLTVTVRGVPLHYTEEGTGPAVVFVHGSMGGLADWDAQRAAFAGRYRVIVYSRRFHSPNAPLPLGGEYTMDEHAEDLAALIRALHAAPAHVVGHSYGAYTALRMALRHPDLVRSLVLAEPPILGWVAGTREADSARRALFADALDPSRDAFARGDSVDGMRRFLDGVSGKTGWFDAMPEPARQAMLGAATEMRGEMTTPRDRYMPAITCDEVGALKRPTLVLSAERSPRFLHIVTDRLRRCLTSVDTGTVPNTGHALQMGNPTAFNDQVLRFLASH